MELYGTTLNTWVFFSYLAIDATTSDGVRNLFEVEQGIQSDEEDDMYFST